MTRFLCRSKGFRVVRPMLSFNRKSVSFATRELSLKTTDSVFSYRSRPRSRPDDSRAKILLLVDRWLSTDSTELQEFSDTFVLRGPFGTGTGDGKNWR